MQITGASFPGFSETVESWGRITYSGTIRKIYHEDVLDRDTSEKNLKEFGDLFWKVRVNDPPIKQGPSILWLFDQTETEFILHWEDDQKLVMDVDLDELVHIMHTYKEINQIIFSHRPSPLEKPNWRGEVVTFAGKKFLTSPHWSIVPGLWRRSFIEPFIRSLPGTYPINWLLNDAIRTKHGAPKCKDGYIDAAFVKKYMGTYYLGPPETQTVLHLGAKSRRMKDFQW